MTRRPGPAGERVAGVGVNLAVLTREPPRTRAGVIGDQVLARAPVLTEVGGTAVIDVDLACDTGETTETHAFKAIHTVNTHAPVETWGAVALLDVHLAVISCKTRQAETLVSGGSLQAGGVVEAR